MGPDSQQARWAIQEAKAFLDPYRKLIHSLILIGSYALGHARKDSDVDFLVLTRGGEKVSRLSRILFDWQLSLQSHQEKTNPVKLQITDFDEKRIEHLFEVSSPLAHSARHGEVIWDKGWFKTLLSRPYPKWPTKEGAIEAFTRWIIWQYYYSILELKRDISRHHGPEGLCTETSRCQGHLGGDILARVISRMLYVTLPARGFLPLSKLEASAMAVETYGRTAWRPIMLAMSIIRKERLMYHREFRVLFPFARSLFCECLRICGPRHPKVLEALKHNAEIYRAMREKADR
ncbi:MAG: nucleotidyltransferase domain-containing protein [Thermodesulfobacteriota bacterium]